MLSESLRTAVAELLGLELGSLCARAVSGGCIASAYQLSAPSGPLFLKCLPADGAAMLHAEAHSLGVLAGQGAIRVPAVIGQVATESQAGLVLEYIELQPLSDSAARRLGYELAELHGCTAAQYGWPQSNWIGASKQHNGWSDDWAVFFARQRLGVQLDMLAASGLAEHGLLRLGERLMACLPDWLAGYRPAVSLLHGDLWSGNVAADASGRPVIFDPASYYGDAETDIAMTKLFGSLPDSFYRAYAEVRPPQEGWQWRSEVYQLYHILNHLNLFGSGYAAQARQMLAGIMERASC